MSCETSGRVAMVMIRKICFIASLSSCSIDFTHSWKGNRVLILYTSGTNELVFNNVNRLSTNMFEYSSAQLRTIAQKNYDHGRAG